MRSADLQLMPETQSILASIWPGKVLCKEAKSAFFFPFSNSLPPFIKHEPTGQSKSVQVCSKHAACGAEHGAEQQMMRFLCRAGLNVSTSPSHSDFLNTSDSAQPHKSQKEDCFLASVHVIRGAVGLASCFPVNSPCFFQVCISLRCLLSFNC